MAFAAEGLYQSGFENPVEQSQQCYRYLLEGFSRPGRWASLGAINTPTSISSSLWTILLTLCDVETPVWLSPAMIAADDPERHPLTTAIKFYTASPIVEIASQAQFALLTSADADLLKGLAIGTPEYPDRSATCLVDLSLGTAANTGAMLHLACSGPGFADIRTVSLPGLSSAWLPAMQENRQLFPLGLDFIFCRQEEFLVIPRSTSLEAVKCTSQ